MAGPAQTPEQKKFTLPARELLSWDLPVEITAALFRSLVVNGREPFIVNGVNFSQADDPASPDFSYPFPVDSHELMENWAVNYQQYQSLIERFRNSMEHPLLPRPEKKYLLADFTQVQAEFETVAAIFQAVFQGSEAEKAKLTAAQISQGAAIIRRLEEQMAEIEELVSVTEAMIDGAEQFSAEEMKQKMAQQILEEIQTTFESKSSQRVSLSAVNGKELAEVFVAEVWSDETAFAMNTQLEKWQAMTNSYIREVKNQLHLLWAMARGRGYEKTSLFELLEEREAVLEAIETRKKWKHGPFKLFVNE